MPDNSNSTEEVVNNAKKMVKKTLGKFLKFSMIIIVAIVLLIVLCVSSLMIIYGVDTADQLYESVENA